jgi:large subunit ribosomal protein L4
LSHRFPSGTSVSLRESVFFRSPIRADLLQRVVVWQLAKRRQGTAKSKNRAEVSGTGKKAAPQKGRGKARVGSRRAPQFRHGGRAFPKRPRSFDFTLPVHVRRLGLAHALSAKAQSGKLVVVEGAAELSGKSKELQAILDKMGWRSVLIVAGSSVPETLARAAFNLPSVDVLPQQGLNVYDILRREHVALSIDALEYLEKDLLKDV